MGFTVTARTLMHLGSELISSDGIALFELIKNAFDARSTKGVTIAVNIILPAWPGTFPALLRTIDDAQQLVKSSSNADKEAAKSLLEEAVKGLQAAMLADADSSAPGGLLWIEKVKSANLEQLRNLIAEANTITVTDTGVGMSLKHLTDVFLTIGTPTKYNEKRDWLPSAEDETPPVLLGEKGIGRLSVMRLGDLVTVKTTKSGEKHWNLLDIDWRLFLENGDALLESIKIEPRRGERKFEETESGTEIRISLLHSKWSAGILEDFAGEQVCKLNDPFESSGRYQVRLLFNTTRIPIPTMDKNLAKYAHGYVTARLTIDRSVKPPAVQLVGKVEYRHVHNRVDHFHIEEVELLGIAGLQPKQLADMGPFTMEAYWFNRQLLQSIYESGIKVRDLVSKWSGGLMLYRDGFRVFPYGGAEDDWLRLDAKALSSGGYKVNRKQIVGRVNITSHANPFFKDQANREGLVDCPETDALKRLLKYVLENQFRHFLNAVDEEQAAKIDLDFSVLSERVKAEKDALQLSFEFLKTKYPEIRKETDAMNRIGESIARLEDMMASAETLASEFQEGRSQLVNLAALGLTVEMLAHELNRTTRYALGALEEAKKETGGQAPAAMKAIEFQLTTIQKRLSVLDPESVSRRQTKEVCDIKEIAEAVFESHQSTLERLHIPLKAVSITPKGGRLLVKMVKGMLTQILDNLIDNSIYWLRQELTLHPTFKPKIEIEVVESKRLVYFSDNGPGIDEELKDKVFEPFFTRKPPGKGKGLGLYIVSELVKYHNATIELSNHKRIHPGRLNTFVLTLPEK